MREKMLNERILCCLKNAYPNEMSAREIGKIVNENAITIGSKIKPLIPDDILCREIKSGKLRLYRYNSERIGEMEP